MSDLDRAQADYWANRELERDENGNRIPRLADCDWPKEHLRRALEENDELRAALAEALDMLDRRYQEDPSTRDREEVRIAALRERYLGKK